MLIIILFNTLFLISRFIYYVLVQQHNAMLISTMWRWSLQKNNLFMYLLWSIIDVNVEFKFQIKIEIADVIRYKSLE